MLEERPHVPIKFLLSPTPGIRARRYYSRLFREFASVGASLKSIPARPSLLHPRSAPTLALPSTVLYLSSSASVIHPSLASAVHESGGEAGTGVARVSWPSWECEQRLVGWLEGHKGRKRVEKKARTGGRGVETR